MFRTAKHGVGLLLCWFVLAGQVWAKTCDLDGDGDVDLDDITLLQRMLPSRPTVTGPDDPRDANHDGRIDILDVRACVLSCTRAKCSTINQAPFANAGPDQSVSLGSWIPLDGSASRDPEGATLSYAWSLIARPPDSQAVLTAAHSTNPTFRADLPGQYVVQLIVHDGQLASAPATVSILVTNTPPTVSLSAPAAHQSFTALATITVSAEAADSTGSITEVAFYQGSTPIGSATSAPYRITWSNVPAGSYVLKARATDSGGAMTWSAEVPITVAAGGVKLYYLHHDHLNTPRLVTDEANRVVWRNTPLGEPFGMSLPEEDPDGDGQAFTLNLRFPGQYADTESHLNYNYFRDYDPITGRYVQSDPIGLGGGINTYAYVKGNPLKFVDPEGLAFCWFSISAGRLTCVSDDHALNNPFALDIPVASGNNGYGMQCKNNPSCTHLANRGPIPQGMWGFGAAGSSGKPNGRRLTPHPGTNTYNRSLLASHSCLNAFGPSLNSPFCSEGCITGSSADIQRLNQLIDSEPGSILLVTD
ncbi:RHS repeat-associated core domain-containing protein [Candidatus Accumulibacter contiguus]|jgi:RHS repeat-associated protein|uniref:RHS repeat-associated core domain-containing protein n=1 Tax=Candidatus Accumulibacter contiguus TaxID=2954381 RepID=UPI002FC300EB